MIKTRQRTYVLLKSLVALVCFIFAVYNFLEYKKFDSYISDSTPITYRVVKTVTNSGGRGSHYNAIINFEGKEYKINSTSTMNADFEKGKYRSLYYLKDNDKIISDWDVTLKLRLSLLVLLGFVVFTVSIFLKFNSR